MPLEAWKLAEGDKKQKEKSEREKKLEQNKLLENLKSKDKISEFSQTDEALWKLKDLLKGKDELDLSEVDINIIKKAIEWGKMTDEEIESVLEKIDEIEKTEDVDKYLPKESRITKEEYKKALVNEVFRVQVQTKLDTALTILANHANPWAVTWINLFSWYMAILDKKLVRIQENHIDIKDSLEWLEEKRWRKKWLWKRFIEFIKELLK